MLTVQLTCEPLMPKEVDFLKGAAAGYDPRHFARIRGMSFKEAHSRAKRVEGKLLAPSLPAACYTALALRILVVPPMRPPPDGITAIELECLRALAAGATSDNWQDFHLSVDAYRGMMTLQGLARRNQARTLSRLVAMSCSFGWLTPELCRPSPAWYVETDPEDTGQANPWAHWPYARPEDFEDPDPD